MSTPTPSDFLYALRLQRDITQARLAELSGCSASTVSLIERGKHVPHLSTIAEILDALRASKELTRSEKIHAQNLFDLPSEYFSESPTRRKPLEWDDVEQDPRTLQQWISHCVTEMTLVLGQEAMLDLLLSTARTRGISIPKSPSV